MLGACGEFQCFFLDGSPARRLDDSIAHFSGDHGLQLAQSCIQLGLAVEVIRIGAARQLWRHGLEEGVDVHDGVVPLCSCHLNQPSISLQTIFNTPLLGFSGALSDGNISEALSQAARAD